jgi:hypothetical protein
VTSIAEKEAELAAANERFASFDPTPGGRSRGKQYAQRVDAGIRRLARLAETVRRLERELTELQRAETDEEPTFVAMPETIQVGDLIATRLVEWRRVVRVNKKSVSVETGYSWTDTVPYAKILRHRRVAATD